MIKINIEKAKLSAHEERRALRVKQFDPVDGGSEFTILNDAGQGKRNIIKADNAELQTQIDEAKNLDELKEILTTIAQESEKVIEVEEEKIIKIA